MEKQKDKYKVDNKKSPRKKSDKDTQPSAPPRPVVVADEQSLITAIMTSTPFELGITYTSLSLPISTDVSMVPIFQALKDNTTVTELIIVSRMWEQEELKEFVRCLSSANKSIETIILRGVDFKPNFVEALAKILKSNLQIKNVEISRPASMPFNVPGFDRFCDGMEYYHFEKLELANPVFGNANYKKLFDSLKYNQSIKTMKLTSDYINGEPFEALCNSLISNPTITDLSFNGIGMTVQSYELFKNVLKANYIKKLEFTSSELTTANLTAIAEEFKKNTSVTDLTVQHTYGDLKTFGDIISHNKSIKKLDMSLSSINNDQFKHLNIGSNTTLKELDLTNCYYLDNFSVPLLELSQNNTIERLHIGHTNGSIDPVQLMKFLSENKSVIELAVHRDIYTNANDATLKALADGLKVNRTIRKLAVLMPASIPNDSETISYFISALKCNNTVTELHTTKLSNVYITYLLNSGQNDNIDDLMLDLLKTNKTLRYITGAEDYPYLEERLKSNRDTQDRIIRDTCTWIKMIVMKPHSFVLPIELWLNIITYVSYDCTSFDFGQFFSKFVK